MVTCPRLALVLLTALPPIPAPASDALSLEAALARANSQNPELKAMRERAGASATSVEATRRQNLPRIGVDLNAQHTNNAAAVFASRLNASEFGPQDFEIARLNAPGALSHLGTSLWIEAPLDIAGRVNLAAAGQAAGSRASTEYLREAEAALSLQVTEAYFGAVLSQRSVDAVQKALAAARSREEVTQTRFAEGLALQSDVLRVRARRRAREADLASQRAELSVAEAMLRRLLGAPEDAVVDLTDQAKPGNDGNALETWTASANTRHPAVRAAQEQQTAAAMAVRLEEKSSWPELSAQARLMDDRISFSGGGQSWAIGAALRWSILDPTRDQRRAGVIALERATTFDERATRDRVRFEVEAAFRRLTAARERLSAAAGGTLEGREALRVVQERRAQGLATLTDELETEAEAYAVELEEISAARTTILAEAALRRAAGANPLPGSPVQ